jgi:prepilin-type N-terminal cleavage/methylation domain
MDAYSLPELLVVLVIIGILVLIALPNLMPLISRAKSVEAQQQLVFLHSLQKSSFLHIPNTPSLLMNLALSNNRLLMKMVQPTIRLKLLKPMKTGSEHKQLL